MSIWAGGRRARGTSPRLSLSGDRLMVLGAVVAALYLLGPPIGMTVYAAFRVPADMLPFERGASWGVGNFTQLYTTGALQSTLLDTFIFVAGSVVLATALGFALAWLVERTNLPFRSLVFVLLLFPLMMPSIIVTMGWVLLLGESKGMLNVVIRTLLPFWESGPFDIFTMYGMVIVQGFGLTALTFLFCAAALRNMDPALEEASRTSGARFLTTLRRVTLPLLTPSILGVVLLAAILAMESFEVPILLALGAQADILSTRIYFALNSAAGNPPLYGEVAALGLHFMALAYLLFIVYHRLTRRSERYATVMGRGYRPRRYDLGRWRAVVLLAVALVLFVNSIAPFLVLLWTSFLPSYFTPGSEAFDRLSFSQYGALFADQRLLSAAGNTLAVALGAATLSVLVALVIAWAVVRAKVRSGLRVALDLFTSSSIAIPGVVAASAFLLFYLRLNNAASGWLPLYGTVVVLVLAYAYRMAVAYRLSRAGVTQVSRELEEASHTSGGSGFQTWRRVLLPLVAPSAFNAWVLLFLVAFREFTLPMVLHRGSDPLVVSVLVFKLWQNYQGQAAALGVLTVGFLALTLLVLRVSVMRRAEGS